MTTSEAKPSPTIALAAEVVAAFVANNSLPIGDLPSLILSVRGALENFGRGPVDSTPPVENRSPAVSIRKSITPDFLVCLDEEPASQIRTVALVDFLPDSGEDSRCESGAFDDEEEPPDAFPGV